MHSFAYTRQSFEGLYRKTDRSKYGVWNKATYEDHVAKLRDRINSPAFPYHFRFLSKKNRKLCSPADYETALLVRKVNSDLQRLVNAQGTARADVVKAIRCICAEGIPYSIVRLDIKRFYDSIDIEDMIEVIGDATRQTYALRRNVEAFLLWSKGNFNGVPTGLSLSATLAEYYISQRFDPRVRALPGVNFYTRYVDDIIMVCAPGKSGNEYISEAEALLPLGWKFNSDPEKKKTVDLTPVKSRGAFEYLGYAFNIGSISGNNNGERSVSIDIAKSKVNRRKSRFVRALLQFLKDGSEVDLKRRHLLINSGYTYIDSATKKVMSAGICNTYSEIDFPSASLLDLQNFYSHCLLSSKFHLSSRLKLSHLSGATKRSILALNVSKHVEGKVYISFNESELTRLTRCWKDV